MRRSLAFLLLQSLVPVGLGVGLVTEQMIVYFVALLGFLIGGPLLWLWAYQKRDWHGSTHRLFLRATALSLGLWLLVWSALSLVILCNLEDHGSNPTVLLMYLIGVLPYSVGCQAWLRVGAFRPH
jgi:hypothetical protein